VFVLNRLIGMANGSTLRAIQPVPFTPLLKPLPPWVCDGSRMQSGLRVDAVPMLYIPRALKSLDGYWLARSIGPLIERLHREEPIDLIDAHFGYPDGAGCLQVGKRLGVPVFVTVRGFETELAEKPFVGSLMIRALREAAGCVAVSHTLGDLLIRHGVEPQRVRVIHNAIDHDTFKYGDRLQSRNLLGLDPTRPLIVSVGHLITRKRHNVLIDAFAELRRSHPAAVLAVVGARSFEPDTPERLRTQVEKLGLQGSVRFVGNLAPADVVPWLQAADAFALLSAREGCCNAVLESLAVGVPTIVTPAGDNARFVFAGDNGEIVPFDEASAVTSALARCLARRDWDRSAIARRLAAQVGDWQAVGERVLEFFSQRLHADAPLLGGGRIGASEPAKSLHQIDSTRH
jgi:glycosyltransferase involved in cell wall biosynthesis